MNVQDLQLIMSREVCLQAPYMPTCCHFYGDQANNATVVSHMIDMQTCDITCAFSPVYVNPVGPCGACIQPAALL
jgi:hypothetical protein